MSKKQVVMLEIVKAAIFIGHPFFLSGEKDGRFNI